jgi:hypothetical protein
MENREFIYREHMVVVRAPILQLAAKLQKPQAFD